jgi:hypothetical protein
MRQSTLLVFFVLLAACDAPNIAANNEPLEQWLGAEPHFAVQGRINGEDLDLRLPDDIAADATSLSCRLEYDVPVDLAGEPDFANGRLKEIKLRAPFQFGSELRVAELELKHHDFQRDPTDVVNVVPRPEDNTLPAANEMWLEWEWHLAVDGEEMFEAAAESGTFALGQLTGTPGPDGLVIPEGEGSVGGFARATWVGGEELLISVTAPCTESDVDTDEP